MPIVSVVMPVRDAAPYLNAAIESVLAQTFSDLELIIVDDGSRDGSSEIIARWAVGDQRVRVLRHEALGIVPALQAGLASARADLVARMDGDDLALPHRLERQVAALEANPQAAVIGSACQMIDAQGAPLRQQSYPTSAEAIRQELGARNCIAHPAVLMRKAAVLEVGGYRAPFALCEDYDLWLRLCEHHDLLNLDEALLQYRLHPGQSSWKSHRRRILSELAALACGRARRNGLSEPALPESAVDRAFLRTMGLSEAVIAQEIAERSLAAAQDAQRLNLTGSAMQALAVALVEPGTSLRWRASALRRFATLMVLRR